MTDIQLHQIAADFFCVFSRTERALKKGGFNNGDGPAEANWGRFAKTIEAAIENPATYELQQAIEYILNAPPNKQFLENGEIKWKDITPQSSSQSDILFQYIRRIRNNLFHGGKFNNHWFSPERSEKLLKASLVILHAAIEAEPNIQKAYHD